MKRKGILMAAFVFMAAASASAANGNGNGKGGGSNGARGIFNGKKSTGTLQGFFFQGPDEESVQRIVNTWQETPQKVAKLMIEKYGQPHEATPNMLIWRDNGPWKYTIVHREEVAHDFPRAHTDVLEQAIDYKVPVSKFDDLARYDGSVKADRTKGELSARCDSEEANFLALNLADELIRGRRTADEARREYARVVTLSMTGQSSELTEKLQFNIQDDTGDKDKTILKDITE